MIDESLTIAKLCDKGYHTKESRRVTTSEKKAICRDYGVSSGCPGPGYELDHLIPIELGGSNDRGNLWPEPADAPGVIGFHTKDVVENRAHAAVCRGELTLYQAQQRIAEDWYAFGIAEGWIPSR